MQCINKLYLSDIETGPRLDLVFANIAGKQCPDSKVHGANMGPTWVLSAPDGPHVGPMNLAIIAEWYRCTRVALGFPVSCEASCTPVTAASWHLNGLTRHGLSLVVSMPGRKQWPRAPQLQVVQAVGKDSMSTTPPGLVTPLWTPCGYTLQFIRPYQTWNYKTIFDASYIFPSPKTVKT